jgi:hypothetical protein
MQEILMWEIRWCAKRGTLATINFLKSFDPLIQLQCRVCISVYMLRKTAILALKTWNAQP